MGAIGLALGGSLRLVRVGTGVLALLSLLVGAREARAGQTGHHDDFEGSPSQWFFSASDSRGIGQPKAPVSIPHSGTYSGTFGFIFAAPTTSWSQLGTSFTLATSHIPTACSATVYVKPFASDTLTVQFDIIDTITDTYMSSTAYSLPAGDWTQISTGSFTAAHSNELTVRLFMWGRGSGHTEFLWVDDLDVECLF